MSSENFLKNIDLNRKTGTRESNPNILPNIKLEEIKRDFDNNISRIEEKFKIIEELEEKDLNEAAEDILRSQIVLNIVSQNERKTFMATKKIKEALEIISKRNIFKNALKKTSEELNINHKELEEKLKELYARRNKIAHQSDRNPISKTINHIEANYVKQYINIMKSLVSNIHDEINAEV